ncbi:MAG: cation transporter, partial [Salinivirgaceae bacterium]|nr:cation transporter [Salinivirgaceae bacterium]
MQKSIYNIPEMDCPSEENLIRMKLDGVEGIRQLEFDIENRSLFVFHSDENSEITRRLESLNLGAKLVKTEKAEETDLSAESTRGQTKLLWTVLLINFGFFIIEITTGFISRSMGLVADSLDMLA